MANPFLFEADYGGGMGADPSLTSASAAASANPFLDFGGGGNVTATMDYGASAMAATTAVEANPFLSYQPPTAAVPEATYTTMTHDTMMSTGGGGATNPFASFVDASMEVDSSVMVAPATGAQSMGAAVFGALPSTTGTVNQGAALFGGTDTTPAVAVDMLLDIQDEPTRPPPASVPSSTKDLLETVTGALEATSDSLLDRLRATQPSPIPQVVQPSPSPRSPSPDLLMGDDPPPPPPPSANPLQPSPGFNNQVDSIMDMFDAPKSGPKSSQEILGLYNSATTTAAPSKGDALVDLLDSIPPSIPATAPVGDATTAVQPPSVPLPQTTEEESKTTCKEEEVRPTPPTALELHKTTNVAAAVPVSAPEEVAMAISPSKPAEEAPSEPVRPAQPPQPMRPPPPAPAPKAAPPERPKPPPVPQQPAPAPVAADPPPAPPSPVVSPPQPVEPAAATAIPPEQRSPLPSRPPPPVPPAPRVSPQPQQISEPQPPSKSPSPPTVVSKTTTPSPTRAPPVVPPQPKAAPPPAAAPLANIFAAAPAVPPSANIFQPSTASVTSNSISNSSALFGSSNATTTNSSPFGSGTADYSTTGGRDAFSSAPAASTVQPAPVPIKQAPAFASATAAMGDSFDAFEAKFSKAGNAPAGGFGDAFGGGVIIANNDSAWGDSGTGGGTGNGFGAPESNDGFGTESGFDSFLSLTEPPPVPQSTPAKRSQAGDDDFDDEEKDMAIVIKPKSDKDFSLQLAPALAPPPKSPAMSTGSAFSDENTAYVPFLSSAKDSKSGTKEPPSVGATTTVHRSDSQDSPQTPLYEEDQSQPLEDFPRIQYEGDGWEMFMRLPNKKKITGQRFWKKCFVKVGHQNDVPIVQIYNNKGDKDPFQEIPLQPCYSVSEISAQQFDQYGKVFTIKIQYIFYKERPGVRPGQISKASRISDKLTQFAAYAIQGDYSGVKEFGSDLKKLGAPIEHSPQISQLVKLGIPNYEDIKVFSIWIEENLFRMPVHRDRAINYKTEEIQVTLVDEYYAEQDIYGVVTRQIARVRLFFLSFLNGNAEIEMGVNDLRRQGKEIVGRHDICPVPTEEWIRMEAIEFSNCVQLDEFENTQTIKFKPPDACYIELMRFRVRPPRHRELPLQVKTVFTVLGQRIEIRSDILVPGFTSRKLGQIPCEDVSVRFPIPEEWIYMFRVEKHFRYGSVKSAHRRSGKVKGIERLLGAVEAVEQSLMETTSGQAKYEHHHKAIVWRIPRLPKEGQGAYTTHSFFCHITLQSHERIPENLTKHCYVEFTMPHTTISHTVCRSISAPQCDEPPEKCCRYLSRHEYIVEIEHTQGMSTATYTAAAAVKKEEPPPPVEEEKPMPGKAESDSDFSDD